MQSDVQPREEGPVVVGVGQDVVLDITPLGCIPRVASRDFTLEDSSGSFGEQSGSEMMSLPRGDEGVPSGKLLRKPSSIPPWQVSSTRTTVPSSNKTSCKLRKKFRSMQTFACSPDQDPKFLKGVEQRGKGIGFTFTLPTATHSSLTVCSTTPETCYGFFWRGLLSGNRKGSRHMVAQANSGMVDSVMVDPGQELCAIRRESGDSFPGGLSPFLLSSPFSDTAVNTPTSMGTV